MSQHRKPIMPASFTGNRTPGVCRWCGLPILTPDGKLILRRTWHAACVDVFKLATDSSTQRQKVFKRDKGICARCGKDTMAEKIARDGKWWRGGMPSGCGHLWQADHIRALCNGDRNDLTLYGLDNLATLCIACHKSKSARDVAILARNRREAKQPALL